MFKFVVLSAVLAVAVSAPAPGYLGGYALPAATSYSSRVDVHHSKPIIASYAAPLITKTVVAAPISYAYPAVSHGAVEYGGYGLGHDLGYGYGGLGHDYAYGHGW